MCLVAPSFSEKGGERWGCSWGRVGVKGRIFSWDGRDLLAGWKDPNFFFKVLKCTSKMLKSTAVETGRREGDKRVLRG